MNHEFQNGDLVTTRTGPGLGDVAITGRVVGLHNPSGALSTDFYIILLEKKVEGFPWSTMILPGVMLDKLTVLDEMACDKIRRCHWCGNEGS